MIFPSSSIFFHVFCQYFEFSLLIFVTLFTPNHIEWQSNIFFLISFSVSSLWVFVKATGFHIFILYLTTSLKVFIKSKDFMVDCVWSFKYSLVPCANRARLTSSLPGFTPFISFSCLAAKTSSTTLNQNSEVGITVSFLILEKMLSAIACLL